MPPKLSEPLESDWIGAGKLWGDAPTSVKQAVEAALQIPNVLNRIVPTASTMISHLRTLPPVPPVVTQLPSGVHAIDFFTTKQPNASDSQIFKLSSLACPPPSVIDALYHCRYQEVLNGSRSIILKHLPREEGKPEIIYPLGLVEFWHQFLMFRKPLRKWHNALSWSFTSLTCSVTEESESSHSENEAGEKMLDRLDAVQARMEEGWKTLEWNEQVDNLAGGGSCDSLASFLSFEWLTSTNNDQLIAAARKALHRTCTDKNGPQPLLLDSLFSQILFETEPSDSEYESNALYRQHREVGSQLGEGKTTAIGMLANVNSNHWYSLVVDMTNNVLGYGDSMGMLMDESHKQAVTKWLSRHLPAHHPLLKTSFTCLRITRQADTHSCLILAHNSLLHYFLGDGLLRNSIGELALRRAEVFCDVVDGHLAQKCSYQAGSFRSKAFGAQFSMVVDFPLLAASISSGNKHGGLNITPQSPSPSLSSKPQQSTASHSPNMGNIADSISCYSSDSSWSGDDLNDDEDVFAGSLRAKPSQLRPIAALPRRARRIIISPSSSESSFRSVDTKNSIEHRFLHCLQASAKKAVSILAAPLKRKDRTPLSSPAHKRTKNPPSPSLKQWISNSLSKSHSNSSSPVRADSPERPRFKQTTLGFKVLTEEEKKAKREADAGRYRQEQQDIEERREELEDMSAVIQQRTILGKRRYEAERKAAQRAKKKRWEIDCGLRDADGRLPKKQRSRKIVDLLPNDTSTSDSSSRGTLADNSRPHRTIRERDRNRKKKRSGRKRKHEYQSAKTVDWFSPLVVEQMNNAIKTVGYPWRSTDIIKCLQHRNNTTFQYLHRQRFSEWRDRSIKDSFKWTPEVKARIARRHLTAERSTQFGVLTPYQDLVNDIVSRLRAIRKTGAPVNLFTARALMLGMIAVHPQARHILEVQPDGKQFTCSEPFVRIFLRRSLKWSIRRGTKAAQKTPIGANAILDQFCMRVACRIRDDNVPQSCIVNTDQTGVTYGPGDSTTYDETGIKQVAIVGQEDKKQFTCAVGASASGVALPFQAVFPGKSSRSLPKPSESNDYDKAVSDLGMKFEYSGGTKHWSTHKTMHSYVTDILVSYFDTQRQKINRPDQPCIWIIDCWSVHRSEAFRTWMRENYPWISMFYIPGGCTGLIQPCDVVLQRILKHVLRRAMLMDMVAETIQKLDNGDNPEEVLLDKSIITLRNRAVGWLVKGYERINDKSIVLEAFRKSGTDRFNLSFESLTSPEMLKALRDLRNSSDSTEQAFYRDISGGNQQALSAKDCEEDHDEDEYGDRDAADLDLSPSALLDIIALPSVDPAIGNDSPEDDPTLDHLVDGFRPSDVPPATSDENEQDTEPAPASDEPQGRGKRIRKRNTQFGMYVFNGDEDIQERTLFNATFGWLRD